MKNDQEIIRREILPFVSPNIFRMFARMPEEYFQGMEEIRLRRGQPIQLRIGEQDYTIDEFGHLTADLKFGYTVTADDINRSIASISDNSIYAFEEDISRGFITIPGGHRVGLAGKVVQSGHQVKTIKEFSSLSFRVAREIPGCALNVINYVYPRDLNPVNTLFVGAPRCGKTSILRDVARNLSHGTARGRGCNVAVIDERSELAGTYQGVAQLDVGPRTDVLDSCPKAIGMMMAIRSLSPDVLVTDEIGRPADVEAIIECVNAGVAIVASIHALNVEEAMQRPVIKEMQSVGAFINLVVLSRRRGPGTIEQVIRREELCG